MVRKGVRDPAGALSVMLIYHINYVYKVFFSSGLGKVVRIGPRRLGVPCKMPRRVTKDVFERGVFVLQE